MENNIANSRGKSIEQAGGLLMAFRKFFPTLPLRSLLACIFVFVAAGCDSGPGRTEWSASSLEKMVKELQANGIDASAAKTSLFGKKNNFLYLNINLKNKNMRRPGPVSDAMFKADRLAMQQSVQKDFEIIARVLRDRDVPLLKFSGHGSLYSLKYVSTLQCKYLGLWVESLRYENAPDAAKLLSDVPALKRLYINDGTGITGITFPLVDDVFIGSLSFPALFKIETLMCAFPNMRSLTLPGRAAPIDYGAVKFPASLAGFSITSGGNPVINAYNLNGAKNLPGITRINGVPVDTFDPVKNLTPEQLVQYNAIPAHIWAEKRFAAFLALAQPEKSGGSVPLRGKIMLHAQGDFLPQEVREGVDERLRNAMTENADECDVLVVIATQEYQRPDLRWVGDSAPVIDTITVMRIFSKNGENEAHAVFFEPKLSNVTEDQKERNARYLATGVWGEMELLFKKGNAE